MESVPLYASLRKRNLRELAKTLASSTIICVVVYNMVGIFGYLTFGQFVKTDILASYYPLDAPVIAGMGMVALKSVMTFPVMFFVGRLGNFVIQNSICIKDTKSFKHNEMQSF